MPSIYIYSVGYPLWVVWAREFHFRDGGSLFVAASHAQVIRDKDECDFYAPSFTPTYR
jgi:hypothetical protein